MFVISTYYKQTSGIPPSPANHTAHQKMSVSSSSNFVGQLAEFSSSLAASIQASQAASKAFSQGENSIHVDESAVHAGWNAWQSRAEECSSALQSIRCTMRHPDHPVMADLLASFTSSLKLLQERSDQLQKRILEEQEKQRQAEAEAKAREEERMKAEQEQKGEMRLDKMQQDEIDADENAPVRINQQGHVLTPNHKSKNALTQGGDETTIKQEPIDEGMQEANGATPATPMPQQNKKLDPLLDSPPTPALITGNLSLATRRLLEQSSTLTNNNNETGTNKARQSTSGLTGSNATATPRRGPSLVVDSPPTPELACVQLALHTQAQRAARKNGHGATTPAATGILAPGSAVAGLSSHRKRSISSRESLGLSVARAPRTPGAISTPARQLFATTNTPRSTRATSTSKHMVSTATKRVHDANTPQSSAPSPTSTGADAATITIPGSISTANQSALPSSSPSSSATQPQQLQPLVPVHFGLQLGELDDSITGTGAGDGLSHSMSMSDSLIATPELKVKAHVAAAASAKKATRTPARAQGASAMTPSRQPRQSPLHGAAPTTPAPSTMTFPSPSPSCSTPPPVSTPLASVAGGAIMQTPRTAGRKARPKTPRSSVRRSTRIQSRHVGLTASTKKTLGVNAAVDDNVNANGNDDASVNFRSAPAPTTSTCTCTPSVPRLIPTLNTPPTPDSPVLLTSLAQSFTRTLSAKKQ